MTEDGKPSMERGEEGGTRGFLGKKHGQKVRESQGSAAGEQEKRGDWEGKEPTSLSVGVYKNSLVAQGGVRDISFGMVGKERKKTCEQRQR